MTRIESVAAAMPRLRALRDQVRMGVSLHLEVWVYGFNGKERAIWKVWNGTDHYLGDTIDEALSRAELGLIPRPMPEEIEVELPAGGATE